MRLFSLKDKIISNIF